MQIGPRRLLIMSAALVALAACAEPGPSSEYGVLPHRLPEPAYEELFPYYVEMCALSQFERVGIDASYRAGVSGRPGHAVLYLKGVCREEDAPIPTLRMCPEVVNDLADPRHGTGVSVNGLLKNVNWMAFPGRKLFYNGDLERGQTLTLEHFRATQQKVIDLGLLRGIEVHEEYVKPGRTPEDYLAESLLGTDAAIRFARSLWCESLPLEREQVELIIAHLNDLNLHYATTDESYEWSFYYDNCVHVLRNSLAAASVWTPKGVRLNILDQLFQMALPANEFIELANRTALFPLDDFGAVFGDETMVESLQTYEWLPTRHGALVKTAPVHRPNELYGTRVNTFVIESLEEEKSRRVDRLMSDARFNELEANLLHYEELYGSILAERDDSGWWPHSDAYHDARRRYYEYVESQLAEVRTMLERLPPAAP